MQNNTIKEVRSVLLKELEKHKGKPVTLNLDDWVLKEILFDSCTDKNGYFFAREFLENNKTIELLKKIDFSNVSFDGFIFEKYRFDFNGFQGIKINPQTLGEKTLNGSKVAGIEFTGSFDEINIVNVNFEGSVGAVINPQTIKSKCLYNTKLKGVTIEGSFDGCGIDGANFTGSVGAKINPQNIASQKLVCCTFADVEFTGSFDNCKIEGSDFTGSVGAVINPQNICGKLRANLNSVTIIGNEDPYENININYTNFKGAKGNLRINPQTVLRKELNSCIFAGVTFVGSFDGCSISGSNFEGSKGAKINPQELSDNNLSFVIFKDTYIDGSTSNCYIIYSNFAGAKGVVIDPQLVRAKKMTGCVLTDAIVVDNFKDVDIEGVIFDGVSYVEPMKSSVISEEEKQKRKYINKIKSSFKK